MTVSNSAAAPTEPRIGLAQNTPDAQRRVAAQARLYSDAKLIFNVRLTMIAVLSVVSGITALLTEGTVRTGVGVAGGVGLLLFSIIGGDIERRRRLQAAAIQEEFDTKLFGLPWNEMAVARPSSVLVARAAARYDGGRERDWYADTETTHRPFDVLICQASNLGWGAVTHRIWAWALSGILALLVSIVTVVAVVSGLPADDVVAVMVVPALPLVKEGVEQIKAHFETARDKEDVEAKLNDAWAGGMTGNKIPSEEVLRKIQDRILALRQRNHYVPDWLDRLLHDRSERAMRATAADRVAEAVRHGHG